MAKWRPEGWENPYKPQERPEVPGVTTEQARAFAKLEQRLAADWVNIFEAGADVMLDALRKQKGSVRDPMCWPNEKTGILVFIPDDDEKKTGGTD